MGFVLLWWNLWVVHLFDLYLSDNYGTYQFKTLNLLHRAHQLAGSKPAMPTWEENAEIEYSITEGEGLDMFDVITDQETQEGIITVKKVKHFLKYYMEMKAFLFLWSPITGGNYISHE